MGQLDRLPEEVVELIVSSLESTTNDLIKLVGLSRRISAVAVRVLWRRPIFHFQHANLLDQLLNARFLPGSNNDADQGAFDGPTSGRALSFPYFTYVKELDIRRLARPPLEVDPDAPAAWIAATRVALRIVAACPSVRALRMDGWPPDVTGATFRDLLKVGPSIRSLQWTRVAGGSGCFRIKRMSAELTNAALVSDSHLTKMAGRWPVLHTLRIGIVTPFMWGSRNIALGFEGPRTMEVGRALGGVQPQVSEFDGFARFLRGSPRLEVLAVEPLPGGEGTQWLLEVLSVHAPASLRKLELGRGRLTRFLISISILINKHPTRYLMTSTQGARRLWRSVINVVICTRIETLSLCDPFASIKSICPSLYVLSDNHRAPTTTVFITFSRKGTHAIRSLVEDWGVSAVKELFMGVD
ncbi:hypothetical protein HK101_006369 [Irineochytrium annulatum]|nr:hypothetical protein HK101_006369 [Irineochytrium annulatum]